MGKRKKGKKEKEEKEGKKKKEERENVVIWRGVEKRRGKSNAQSFLALKSMLNRQSTLCSICTSQHGQITVGPLHSCPFNPVFMSIRNFLKKGKKGHKFFLGNEEAHRDGFLGTLCACVARHAKQR
jgi:hypothetical protein